MVASAGSDPSGAVYVVPLMVPVLGAEVCPKNEAEIPEISIRPEMA